MVFVVARKEAKNTPFQSVQEMVKDAGHITCWNVAIRQNFQLGEQIRVWIVEQKMRSEIPS